MSFLRINDTEVASSSSSSRTRTRRWRDPRQVRIRQQPALGPSAHHVKLVLDLLTGAHNDVVQVYIDGSVATGPGRPGEAAGGFVAPVDHPATVNKVKAGQSVPMKWKLYARAVDELEDSYRFQTESNAGIPSDLWTTRPVDSLIFQARTSGGTALNTLIRRVPVR